ncbi:transport and Golgi organization protein 2 [Tanacetum coccineum]
MCYQMPVSTLHGLRLEHGFRDFFNQYGDGELPINEMVDKLMGNTVKDDLSKLPHIYSAEMEYQLSSVFVDGESAEGRYGTRSTSALAVKASGEVFYYEKHLDNDLWKEHIETYMIEKNEK